MGRTLRRVLQLGGPDLAALLQLEGLSQDTTGEAYVQGAVQRVCVEEVAWHSTSFTQVQTSRMTMVKSVVKVLTI